MEAETCCDDSCLDDVEEIVRRVWIAARDRDFKTVQRFVRGGAFAQTVYLGGGEHDKRPASKLRLTDDDLAILSQATYVTPRCEAPEDSPQGPRVKCYSNMDHVTLLKTEQGWRIVETFIDAH